MIRLDPGFVNFQSLTVLTLLLTDENVDKAGSFKA